MSVELKNANKIKKPVKKESALKPVKVDVPESVAMPSALGKPVKNPREKKSPVEKVKKVVKKIGEKVDNPWIAHLRAYAKEHKLSFKDAMKVEECLSEYKNKKEQKNKLKA